MNKTLLRSGITLLWMALIAVALYSPRWEKASLERRSVLFIEGLLEDSSAVFQREENEDEEAA